MMKSPALCRIIRHTVASVFQILTLKVCLYFATRPECFTLLYTSFGNLKYKLIKNVITLHLDAFQFGCGLTYLELFPYFFHILAFDINIEEAV